MCHVLFAVPVVSLLLFGVFPFPEALAYYVVLNGPVLALAWAVWRVHRRPSVTGWEGLIGLRAVAETPLHPDGLVRCKGTLWRAHSAAATEAGEVLRVVRVDNLDLYVEPQRNGSAAENAEKHLKRWCCD